MHTIQSGDSLYKLSRQYKTTVTELILGNPGVNPYNLQVGMELMVCPGADYDGPGMGNTGSMGSGSSAGMPGNMGGGSTGMPGNMSSGNAGNAGMPGSMGSGNAGMPGSMSGGNTGMPGSMGGGSTGMPGSMSSGNTGMPGNMGGGSTGMPGNMSSGNTGNAGNMGSGSNAGMPGGMGSGSNTGMPGNMGSGSNAGMPGGMGSGSNTGMPGSMGGGSNAGMPGGMGSGSGNAGMPGNPADGNMAERCRGVMELEQNMRLAWLSHVYWARMYLMSALSDSPDQQEVEERLLETADEITNVFADYLSSNATRQLRNLLTEHIEIAGEIIHALKAGNMENYDGLIKEWYSNANQIANLLGAQNPYFSGRETRNMLLKHLDLERESIEHQVNGEYSQSIETMQEIVDQAVQMADFFARGLLAR